MGYVLVTGGSQGLGRELVIKYACNGYKVIIGYLSNYDLANNLCEELNSKYGNNCVIEKIDITCTENVKELFNKYKVDILINNASLSLDNYIEDKTYEEFIKVLNVNVGGTYLMCKYAKDVNTIINISSKDGIDTYNPISLDYCASKAAIINLSKNLSLYYKDKRIICICPEWINTESVLGMNPNYLNDEMRRIGQDKLLDKEYVASKIYDISISDIDNGSVVVIDE